MQTIHSSKLFSQAKWSSFVIRSPSFLLAHLTQNTRNWNANGLQEPIPISKHSNAKKIGLQEFDRPINSVDLCNKTRNSNTSLAL